jgi:hypothetical protein
MAHARAEIIVVAVLARLATVRVFGPPRICLSTRKSKNVAV